MTGLDSDDSTTPRYDVEVWIYDADKNQIGFLARTGADDEAPALITSKLEDPLVVRPESQNDYIDFSLPNQDWPSNGQFVPGDARNWCTVGEWYGSVTPPYNPRFRQMDCEFICVWGGRPSSDGSALPAS